MSNNLDDFLNSISEKYSIEPIGTNTEIKAIKDNGNLEDMQYEAILKAQEEEEKKAPEFETVTVSVDDIMPRKINDFSMGKRGIEELAEQIRKEGLLTKPVVRKVGIWDTDVVKEEANGKHYVLIGGHRRLAAINLIRKTNPEMFKEIEVICYTKMTRKQEERIYLTLNSQRDNTFFEIIRRFYPRKKYFNLMERPDEKNYDSMLDYLELLQQREPLKYDFDMSLEEIARREKSIADKNSNEDYKSILFNKNNEKIVIKWDTDTTAKDYVVMMFRRQKPDYSVSDKAIKNQYDDIMKGSRKAIDLVMNDLITPTEFETLVTKYNDEKEQDKIADEITKGEKNIGDYVSQSKNKESKKIVELTYGEKVNKCVDGIKKALEVMDINDKGKIKTKEKLKPNDEEIKKHIEKINKIMIEIEFIMSE